MSFADVESKLDISGKFSPSDKATILAAMRFIYEESPIARKMLDDWVGGWFGTGLFGNRIIFEPNDSWGAVDGQGKVFANVGSLSSTMYIDNMGTARQETAVTAIAHELIHALKGAKEGFDDDADYVTEYRGSVVKFANTIYRELWIPEQNSYRAINNVGSLTLGFEYTEGAEIDRSYVVTQNFGWDSSRAGNSKDLLIGSTGNNTLISGDGNDFLYGQGGDDILDGGKGDDTLVGGTGNDTYIYRMGDGNDTIIDSDKKGRIIVVSADGKSVQSNTTFIQDKNDTNLYVSPDGKIKFTHHSPWRMVMEDGSEIVLGDFAEGDYGIHLKDAQEDPDEIQTNNSITGDQKDEKKDTLTGTAANDLIDGLTDDDNLAGEGGTDHILGGDGNDTLNGGDGNDLVEGGEGNDTLAGDGDNDQLQGGVGQDRLDGGAGDDILKGGEDMDIVIGGAGKDTLYSDSEIDLAQAIANGHSGSGTGKQGDWLNGQNDDDILIGGADNDALFGGNGSDILVGGAGDDILNGDDDYTATSFAWTITSYGNPFDRHHKPIDVAVGNTLGAGSDVLFGGAGNDHLAGMKGDDTLYGDEGDDSLAGDDGADTLFGGAGDDYLYGDRDYVTIKDGINAKVSRGGTGQNEAWRLAA